MHRTQSAKVVARAPACPDCGAPLEKVDYTIWGTKRWDAERGRFDEDETLGNTDMEFRCPNCSAKLEPDVIGLWGNACIMHCRCTNANHPRSPTLQAPLARHQVSPGWSEAEPGDRLEHGEPCRGGPIPQLLHPITTGRVRCVCASRRQSAQIHVSVPPG
jgi:hypothetical protein